MAEILIVGAGPVGLTMAAELVRYGARARIIDRAPHATETSKALVVWSWTLELMDRRGNHRTADREADSQVESVPNDFLHARTDGVHAP